MKRKTAWFLCLLAAILLLPYVSFGGSEIPDAEVTVNGTTYTLRWETININKGKMNVTVSGFGKAKGKDVGWLSVITGGLSGACVKPVALRMVWQVAKAVKIPVVGLGGISNATDAIEFMLAGASAIEIGTANFIDPAVSAKVVWGINEYCERHGFHKTTDLIGALEV